MILNHKDAIEFLASAAMGIGCNRHTLLNLHAILARNLLPDEAAAGQLRHIPVGIEKSVFRPLAIPQQIDACFNQLLSSAAAIRDPFEQALFLMVQLPYLQPFDDVNKRCSRLAANIPLIKGNLAPLSFAGVRRDDHTNATMGVYERNDVNLMKDMFIWAYERSAADYTAVKQSLQEPDPFRMQHSAALRELVGDIVRRRMGREAAADQIASWTRDHIKPAAERVQFSDLAKSELLALHEGNYARHQIKPAEFDAWWEVWDRWQRRGS